VPLGKVKIGTYLFHKTGGNESGRVPHTYDMFYYSFHKAVTEIVAGLLLILKASRLELFPG
jgi:hypothetical protein